MHSRSWGNGCRGLLPCQDDPLKTGYGRSCPELNVAGQTSRDLHSNCFAMVLTAGFYCDSRAHNVWKDRVVKYILKYIGVGIYGQIKASVFMVK